MNTITELLSILGAALAILGMLVLFFGGILYMLDGNRDATAPEFIDLPSSTPVAANVSSLTLGEAIVCPVAADVSPLTSAQSQIANLNSQIHTVCMDCQAVTQPGDPTGPVSHGLCESCYHKRRSALDDLFGRYTYPIS